MLPQNIQRPVRIAVVGAGPAGFYAAQALLKQTFPVTVDVFEKLPVPFGLVRYGVAPDHQKIKNVIRIFEKIAENQSFRFYGNVNVGIDLTVDELRRFYDAVIFCYGTEADRKLGIPGENLANSISATGFVGWYNGLPKFRKNIFDLSNPTAVVIGNGNVAMDVARILCSTPDELKNTDISQYALDVLAESRIREVHVVGRRGPAQAVFTPREIREMGELSDSAPVIDPAELELNEASRIELDDPQNPVARKNFEILKSFIDFLPVGRKKRCIFHFNRTPAEIIGQTKVEKIRFEINKLSGKPFEQKAVGTGRFEEINCGFVLCSIGYTGLPIPGLPFSDALGYVPNISGRVVDNDRVVPGFYVAGWIKRGPSGVIGVNKEDAEKTVAALIEDLEHLPPCPEPNSDALLKELKQKGISPVTFLDWTKIDLEEIRRGTSIGKPREKLTEINDMLRIADVGGS